MKSDVNDMKGTILAGGSGTRLYPANGSVSNIDVYKAQNNIIKDGSIALSDSQSTSVV